MDFIQKLLDAPDWKSFSSVWHAEKPRMNMADSLNGEKVLAYLSFPLPPPKAVKERFLGLWQADEPHQALGYFRRGYVAGFFEDKRLSPLFKRCIEAWKETRFGVGHIDPFGNLNEFENDFLSRHQRDTSKLTLLNEIGNCYAMFEAVISEGADIDAELALSFALDRDRIENMVIGVELYASHNEAESLKRELACLDEQLQRWNWLPFYGMEVPDDYSAAQDAVGCVPITESNNALPFWQRVLVNRPEPTQAELDELMKEESDPALFLPNADGSYEEKK